MNYIIDDEPETMRLELTPEGIPVYKPITQCLYCGQADCPSQLVWRARVREVPRTFEQVLDVERERLA